MKRFILFFAIVFPGIWSCTASNFPDSLAYLMMVKNDTLVKPNEYSFDIYIYNTSAKVDTFYLNAYQLTYSINFLIGAKEDEHNCFTLVSGSSELNGRWIPSILKVIPAEGKTFLRIQHPFTANDGFPVTKAGLRIGSFKLIAKEPIRQEQIMIHSSLTPPFKTLVRAATARNGGKSIFITNPKFHQP